MQDHLYDYMKDVYIDQHVSHFVTYDFISSLLRLSKTSLVRVGQCIIGFCTKYFKVRNNFE